MGESPATNITAGGQGTAASTLLGVDEMRRRLTLHEVAHTLTASGASWRWQLRDSDGKWIEMGSEVSWLAKGLLRTGTIVGSPKEGKAEVRPKGSRETVVLDASVLTALEKREVATARTRRNGPAADMRDDAAAAKAGTTKPAAAPVKADDPFDFEALFTPSAPEETKKVDPIKEAHTPVAKILDPVPEPQWDFSPAYFTVDGAELARIREKANKINERAVKKGLEGKVEVIFKKKEGQSTYDVAIKGEPRLPGGWSVAALIDGSGNSAIVNRNPHDERSLNAEVDKTKAGTCQYCNTDRDRKKTFVLMDKGGKEIKYIGSSCLSDFLGHKVSIASPFQTDSEVDDLLDYARSATFYDGHNLLMATAIIVDTFGFRKTSETPSTRDMVMDFLRLPDLTFRDKYKHLGVIPNMSDADKEKLRQEVDDTLKWARAGVSIYNTDYRANLGAALSDDDVNPKYIGLVVSAISSRRRELQKESEKKAAAKASGVKDTLLAPVGTKFEPRPAKITGIQSIQTAYGISTKITFMDTEGHRVIWWASNPPQSIAVGDEVMLSAKVKKGETFNGTFSTTVTHAKVTPAAVAASGWSEFDGDAWFVILGSSEPIEAASAEPKRVAAVVADPDPVTAGGESWRWQLRDRIGKWIEMGAEVKWLARGRWLQGLVVGSPSPGIATVEESVSHQKMNIPANRLEVFKGTHVTNPEAAKAIKEGGFKPGKGLGGDWGAGTYIGTDKNSAGHYQKFVKGGEVVNVTAQPKNPARVTLTYDPKDASGLKQLTSQIPGLREELLKRDGIANIGMTDYKGDPYPEVLNSEALTPALQALGYDALSITEVDADGNPTISDWIGGSQLVVFNPEVAKPALTPEMAKSRLQRREVAQFAAPSKEMGPGGRPTIEQGNELLDLIEAHRKITPLGLWKRLALPTGTMVSYEEMAATIARLKGKDGDTEIEQIIDSVDNPGEPSLPEIPETSEVEVPAPVTFDDRLASIAERARLLREGGEGTFAERISHAIYGTKAVSDIGPEPIPPVKSKEYEEKYAAYKKARDAASIERTSVDMDIAKIQSVVKKEKAKESPDQAVLDSAQADLHGKLSQRSTLTSTMISLTKSWDNDPVNVAFRKEASAFYTAQVEYAAKKKAATGDKIYNPTSKDAIKILDDVQGVGTELVEIARAEMERRRREAGLPLEPPIVLPTMETGGTAGRLKIQKQWLEEYDALSPLKKKSGKSWVWETGYPNKEQRDRVLSMISPGDMVYLEVPQKFGDEPKRHALRAVSVKPVGDSLYIIEDEYGAQNTFSVDPGSPYRATKMSVLKDVPRKEGTPTKSIAEQKADLAAWKKIQTDVMQEIIAKTRGRATSTTAPFTPKKYPYKVSGMGHHKNASAAVKSLVESSLLDTYPASWVEAFEKRFPQITISERGRGFFEEKTQHLAVSDYSGEGTALHGQMHGTIIHELAHGMESAVPGVRQLEDIWWHTRALGRDPKDTYTQPNTKSSDGGHVLTKGAVSPTRNHYTLKRYGSPGNPDASFEILTTGLQDIFAEVSGRMVGGDEDLKSFTLGIMAVL